MALCSHSPRFSSLTTISAVPHRAPLLYHNDDDDDDIHDEQSYHRQVQRVADFSVKLALMTPHALFAATLIAIKLLVPFALTWLATETNLSSVFYLWYPLLASILVLFDVWRADCNNEQVLVAHVPSNGSKLKKVKKPLEEQKKTLTNSSNAAASPARSSPFPRTTAAVRKRNRRRSSLVSLVVRHNVLDASRSGDNNATEKTDAAAQLLLLHQRQVYWMHYWIVCGAVAMMKRFFFILPFVTRFVKVYPIIRSVLLQVELVAWIWIHVVPTLLTPVGIQQLQQYQTPLDILAVTCIAPVVTAVYNGVSSVVPAAAWQTYVVEACSKFLGVAVWSKLLTQSSCDALLHFTEHGRSLVVPALTVFSWPLQAFGILYVAYVLPLAKCSLVVAAAHSPQKTELRRLPITHWLQFWVLHTVLTGALNTCSALLWWIPFSNVAIWCAYAWLSVVAASSTIDSYYLSYVQQELQSFYILPLGDHQQSLPPTQEAKLMRLFWYIIDKLPKAVDDNDDENASAGDDDASGGDAVVSGDEDAFVGVGLVKKHGTGPSDDDTVSVGEEKENGAARKRYNSKPERDESPSGVDDSVTEDCVGFKQRSSNRSTRKTISKVEREESPSEDESGKDDSSLSSFAKETIASRTRRRRSATSRNS